MLCMRAAASIRQYARVVRVGWSWRSVGDEGVRVRAPITLAPATGECLACRTIESSPCSSINSAGSATVRFRRGATRFRCGAVRSALARLFRTFRC